MNTTKPFTPRTKIVNKDWLDRRIYELNNWLFENPVHEERRQKEHDRNFYVNKLIELEENKFNMIEV